MLLSKLAYTLVFGKPLIMHLGILTLLSLLLTVSIAYASARKVKWIPFKFHRVVGLVTIIFAIIHSLLGFSVYLGF